MPSGVGLLAQHAACQPNVGGVVPRRCPVPGAGYPNRWQRPSEDQVQQVRGDHLGNGRNIVSRVLFRRRELTEFYGKLGEFWGKLGEFALAHK